MLWQERSTVVVVVVVVLLVNNCRFTKIVIWQSVAMARGALELTW